MTAGSTSEPRHRVVIVGGGFAGLFAARALVRSGCDVTLLDRRNFHTFQPLLYQVAIGALTTGDIATPFRLVLRGKCSVDVRMTEVTGIDPARKVVAHTHGETPYDTLIAATGVQHSYFGKDEWAEHAPGLKTLEHALDLRRRIFRALEMAEIESDPERQQALMTFVVVGGGPTGVELAGALGELTMRNMNGDFRRIDPRKAKVILVEGGPDVLPVYVPRLRVAARRSLEALGVEVITDGRVVHISSTEVSIRLGENLRIITSDTVLWAAGVQVSSFGKLLAKATGAGTDRSGRLLVSPDLSLPSHPEIFVAGDLAAAKQPDGTPIPGLAPAAIQAGEYIAHALARRRKGLPAEPFQYRDRGHLAVIGRNHAVGDLKFFHVSGVLAWTLWVFVHVMSLIQREKRLRVFVQWGWRYFSRQTGDRLITGEQPVVNLAANANPSSTHPPA